MLGSEDKAILDFEQTWWILPGPKDMLIEFTLGLSASAYYENLLSLVQRPEAMNHDPLTVKRVLAMIEPNSGCEVAV